MPPGITTADLLAQRSARLAERVAVLRAYLDPPALTARVEELEGRMQEPGFWDDPASASRVSAQHAAVRDKLNGFQGLEQDLADLDDLIAVARDGGDEGDEFLAELSEGLDRIEAELLRLEEERLFAGEHDAGDAIVSINAGEGGTDAQDWAEMLLRMYVRWAERSGMDLEIESLNEGTEAGISSATFLLRGRNAYGWMRSEHGVHRLVRISPFDNNARRQTSFASVKVTPWIDDVDDEIDIDDKDLRIDVYRSSGAGGQHVNVTDSAVRITHLPTGIVTSCQNERSQHQNKDRAMKILKAKLLDLERQKRAEKLAEITGEGAAVDFGSQDRNYVLQPYQQVKDLRSGLELSNPEAVLDGELDDLMEAYLQWVRVGG